MPVSFANTFKIEYDSTYYDFGQQGYSTSKIFYSTIDSLYLSKDLLMVNIPSFCLKK